jgi:hypothetical protein
MGAPLGAVGRLLGAADFAANLLLAAFASTGFSAVILALSAVLAPLLVLVFFAGTAALSLALTLELAGALVFALDIGM